MNKLDVLTIVSICCLILAGCSTYGSKKYTKDVFRNNYINKGDFFVEFDPIVDQEKSIWYLNLPPAKYDLLPVFISIVNKGESVKKINIDASYLIDNSTNNKHESLSVEEAVQMLQTSGWVPTLLFGLPGSVGAGSAEKAKDDDFYRKSFKPRMLNPSARGEGVVFYKVSKKDILNNSFVMYLIIDNLEDNSTEELQIKFDTR